MWKFSSVFVCVCVYVGSTYIKSELKGKFSRRAHAKNTSRRIILSRGGIIEFAQDVFQVIARIALRESRARALRVHGGGKRGDYEILSSFCNTRAPRRARVLK